MKKISSGLWSAVLLCQFFLPACQKDKVAGGIYAPNGALVSTSINALSNKIAPGIGLNPHDFSISAISFLNPSKGYIAEIRVLLSGEGTPVKLYLVSAEAATLITPENDLTRVALSERSDDELIQPGEAVFYCTCGSTVFGSRDCDPEVRIDQQGTVTCTCKATNCPYGCVVHYSGG